MKIYSTLDRELQTLVPRDEGKIAMYVCGATVQTVPHLGHGRYAVVFDVIRRYFEWSGYEVTYVRNITDVEDKIIAAAAVEGVSTSELVPAMVERWTAAYEALGVLPPTIEPRATDHIPEMLELIQALIDRGLAYEAGGDVYFAVRSYEPYGALSRQNPDELRVGVRIEPGEAKHDSLDFALWKAARPDEPQWDSPWGAGRPGWHIECSAMAQKYMGEGFDIHGGGADLIFPHHENEIAQSEGASGTTFARLWVHNGMVSLTGDKMSKSTGNVIDLATILDRYPPMAVRFFYIRAHYRSPIEYKEELLDDAAAAYERLWAFRRRLPHSVDAVPDSETMHRFQAAMDDDFNTPEAVSALFDSVRAGNRALDRGENADGYAGAFDEIMNVLGLEPLRTSLADIVPALADTARVVGVPGSTSPEETIEALIDRRAQARAEGDFETADAVRDRLAALGIIVEDTGDGVRWHRR